MLIYPLYLPLLESNLYKLTVSKGGTLFLANQGSLGDGINREAIAIRFLSNHFMLVKLLSLFITICKVFTCLILIIILWLFVEGSEVLAETVLSPQTCRTGIFVASLRDLNLAEKKFSTDFYLWSVCPFKELQPLKSMKVLNVEDYKYFKTAYDSTLERKDIPKWFYPKENVYWSGRKIRASLYQSWNVSNFPFDRHTLTIALEETEYFICSLI